MRPKIISLLTGCAAAASLAGCSTIVEQRVDAGLTEAGVPAGIASCMAEIWAEDLSVSQIRAISNFAGQVRSQDERLTVGRLIGHVREWNDPQALGVVTSSAARCAFN